MIFKTLQSGKKHHEMDKVVNKLHKIEYKGQTAKISYPINPGLLLPEDSGYYTYQGSLTTPPVQNASYGLCLRNQSKSVTNR